MHFFLTFTMETRKSIKRVSFSDQKAKVDVYIEEILDPAYGCYIWPCSLVMAEFVWYNRFQFEHKTLLEVGAGTSLPSLVLAKSVDELRLILSDIPSILPVIQGCVQRNHTDKDIWIEPIEWGARDSIDHLTKRVETEWDTKIDYILGSDTFYEPSEFENLLVLVSFVIHTHNPNCKFFTAYQERSPKRSIQRLLDKWNLKCRLISKQSFEFDDLKYTESQDNQSEVQVNAGTLSSVFLLEISK
ncbi:putative methyltransferase-domain-containing protein [Gilbertella persicaria]|uniref:putative methyltransferase-domain-containing protein n=1 Tax=Gilbertella persicaria TaxID=101096 RepID=UPI0022204A23|nr:putative methyltransferase-domain-containing protein [Gilbertella persicaria]KAI8079096.1 putative methyltransferase-domain-containing protein [Gilbertella persicaria]